jgi:hypothetical protein
MMDAPNLSITMTLRNLMESLIKSSSGSLLGKKFHHAHTQWLHMFPNLLPIRTVSRTRMGNTYLVMNSVGNLHLSFNGLLLLGSLKRTFEVIPSELFLCLFNQAILLISIVCFNYKMFVHVTIQ